MNTAEMFSGGFEAGRGIAGGITAAVLVGGAAFKAVVRVPTGERGVRTHFGRVKTDSQGRPKIVGPGMHLVAPFTHSVEKISVQDRANDLAKLTVNRAGELWGVASSIVWRVSPEGDNPYRALFLADNLTENVTNLCGAQLGTTLEEVEDIHDKQYIATDVQERCAGRLIEYGVELRRLDIQSIALEPAQIIANALHNERPFSAPANSGGLHVVNGA